MVGIFTDPSQTKLPSGDAVALVTTCLLPQGHMWSFSCRFQSNIFMHPEPHQSAQELKHCLWIFTQHWLLCHYHPQGLQGLCSSYFKLHKWSTSLTVTKQQSPSKVSDFQTPRLCIDEKANAMNHNEDPLLFLRQASAVDKNLKLWITSTRTNMTQRDIVL